MSDTSIYGASRRYTLNGKFSQPSHPRPPKCLPAPLSLLPLLLFFFLFKFTESNYILRRGNNRPRWEGCDARGHDRGRRIGGQSEPNGVTIYEERKTRDTSPSIVPNVNLGTGAGLLWGDSTLQPLCAHVVVIPCPPCLLPSVWTIVWNLFQSQPFNCYTCKMYAPRIRLLKCSNLPAKKIKVEMAIFYL